MYLKEKNTDTVLGALANFTITRDAMPLNPEDGGAQVASFTSVLADVPEDTDNYIGKEVELGLSITNKYAGEIINYSQSDDSGVISVDCATVLQKLNTEQTVLPYMTDYPQHELALTYWMQECGLFQYLTAGDVQSYTGQNDLTYLKNQSTRFYSSGWGQTSPTTAVIPLAPQRVWKDANNSGAKAMPIVRYPGKPILFGAYHRYSDNSGKSWAVEWEFAPSAGGTTTTKLSIKVDGNVATLRERVGDAVGTVIGTLAMPQTQIYGHNIYVLAQPNAADPSLTDFRIRVANVDPAVGATSGVFTYASVLKQDVSQLSTTLIQQTAISYDPYSTYFAYISYAPEMPIYYARQLIGGYTYRDEIVDVYPSKIPGFTGNVWSKIKQFCAIYNYDFRILPDGSVDLSHRIDPANYTNVLAASMVSPQVRKTNVRKQISSRETARFVEVVVDKYFTNPDSLESKMSDRLMWKADSVYSLEMGENKVETVQTDATFLALDQPIPWGFVPVPFSWGIGVYVVTGADGYIVDENWWKDNGGYIKVKPTDKSGEIQIEFQAPNVQTVRAPYRISEGAADRPALYITGTGMRKTPETVRISTGAPYAATEVGVQCDTGFITNDVMAYRVGAKLADTFAGNNVELSYSTPVTSTEGYSTTDFADAPEGKLVYHNGSVFRNSSTQRTPNTLSISKAEQYDPILLVDYDRDDMTVDQWDAANTNFTVDDVDRAPMKKYIG